MTLDELRETVREMRANASERARLYGAMLGVNEAFVESLIPALGDISIDELYTALEREALAERERLRRELREHDSER